MRKAPRALSIFFKKALIQIVNIQLFLYQSSIYVHINAFGTKFLKKLQQANLLFPIRLFML